MWTKEGRIATHRVMTKTVDIDSVAMRLAKGIPGGSEEDWEYGDMDECDFDGYGALTGAPWDVPVINGSEQAEGKSALMTWTAGSLVSSQTILAMYFTAELSDTTEVILWAKLLDPSVTLAVPGEVFQRYVNLFVDDIAGL